ncbi:50S ribosomal protein L10 [Arcobacter sp. FWKO B]|uniref:50S ribosomal protein L10 n=1 Tax=Arcobacter sp. FWKO B TaxID=2593672 RepID=UPI0018A591B4|nr:50S ribosomal protein L10 [Arcobacter sp. FWKO B]QOG12716.1 50S ribosomal protein L10 [Arcobacter sp. FWKO B]
MTRTQKQEILSFLESEFKESNAIVVCDYRGLTHRELEDLRKMAKDSDSKVQVAKNTLVGIAIKNAGLESIELTGTNIFIWSPDQLSACKVADKFAGMKKDKFTIKSGVLEGKAANADMVNAFAKLPGREELLGMLLSVWTAPARNLATGLDNLRAKKEEEAA